MSAHLEPTDEVEVLLHVGGKHEVYNGGAQRLAQAGRCVLQATEAELQICLTAPGLGAGCGEWHTDKQRKLTGAIRRQDAGTGTAEKGGPQQRALATYRAGHSGQWADCPCLCSSWDRAARWYPSLHVLHWAQTTYDGRRVELVLCFRPPDPPARSRTWASAAA